MNDLVEFLRARLDEDERIATAAADGGGPHWPDADGEMRTNQLVHARRHDPARVLREVEAERRIVDAYAEALRIQNSSRETTGELMRRVALEMVCLAYAVAYTDNPDYREEWRP